MAKSKVTAQDMAARLMGSGAGVSAQAPIQPSEANAEDVKAAELPAPQLPAAKAAQARSPKKVAESGTKRLNLNITIRQWRKLKGYAMDRGVSASDVIRDCIDAL